MRKGLSRLMTLAMVFGFVVFLPSWVQAQAEEAKPGCSHKIESKFNLLFIEYINIATTVMVIYCNFNNKNVNI